MKRPVVEAKDAAEVEKDDLYTLLEKKKSNFGLFTVASLGDGLGVSVSKLVMAMSQLCLHDV